MNIDLFLGSDNTKALLKGQFASGSLAHSMLLCGEEGCGTGYFARLLAADLLAADPEASDGAARAHRVLEGIDPDCLEVDSDSAAGMIRIEQIRHARQELQQTSLSGSRRVLIVYGAHRLNGNQGISANALLKIIEEPPEGLYFIFTTSSAAAVLPTIRSRCAAFQLLAPTVQVCADELQRRGVSPADAQRLARVWQGRIGTALSCAAGDRRRIFDAADALCRAVYERNAYAAMKLLRPYEKEKEQLQTLLADAAQILRAGMHEAAAPLPAQQASEAIRAILDAAAALRGNGNVKLLLTHLALQLGD